MCGRDYFSLVVWLKCWAGFLPISMERFNNAPCSVLVYCCCCLANVSLPGIGSSVPELRPFFYINVADINVLATEVSYIACEWSWSLKDLWNTFGKIWNLMILYIYCRPNYFKTFYRYYREDLWGEEGFVRCLHWQPECENTQEPFAVNAASQCSW